MVQQIIRSSYDVVDRHYDILRATNSPENLEKCQVFEFALAKVGLGNADIMQRYEALAAAGFPIAVARLEMMKEDATNAKLNPFA